MRDSEREGKGEEKTEHQKGRGRQIERAPEREKGEKERKGGRKGRCISTFGSSGGSY